MPLLAINHHYFRDSKKGQGIYPTTPLEMEFNLVNLHKNGWKFASQERVVGFVENKDFISKKLCVITFDDGLKEQMNCLSLLEKFNAKAIFFISTSPVVTNRVLDVHKMHLIRTKISDEALAKSLESFGFYGYSFDMDALALQYRYDEKISQKVKYFLNFVLDAEQKQSWINSLFLKLFSSESAVAKSLYMDVDDWKTLAKMGCLATHGHNHLPMATLNSMDIAKDIGASIDLIRDKTCYKVKGIGYPFGGKTAVSNEVFAIASQFDLRYGFTMRRGINLSADNPLALDRIDVNDLDGYLSYP